MIQLNKLLILASLFLLVSCSSSQPVKDSQLALMKTTDPKPLVTDKNQRRDHVKAIKKDVSSYPEIYDVAVVKGKKNTLVAYKVKHLNRFRMKSIEAKVTKMLKKKYPKENFTVSSDYKIFLEAIRLDEQMKAKKLSDKQADNQLNKIIKMTAEMT